MSDDFYANGFYQTPSQVEKETPTNPFPNHFRNTIREADNKEMDKELPEGCIDLIITSPPYNVGKEYDSNMNLPDYLEWMQECMSRFYRVLKYGGRMCINIANIGRKPYIPLSAYLTLDALSTGFLMRGEIIWYKGPGVVSTAWGSYMSSSDPVLRDTHEYIMVFSKGTWGREKGSHVDTITKPQFAEFTKSIWFLNPARATKVGHPAPFPIDLPYRLIQLYSFKGDVVLDPFMGSGSTAIACQMTGRDYFGYETDPEYIEIAEFRIERDKRLPGMELVDR